MSVFIRQHALPMAFNKEAWIILNPVEQSIKTKIEKYGTPLKDWDVNIYRGILTGCNEAFIIDGAKRAELIAADPKSDEIIRPILRGKDIKRGEYNFADKWLICTFPSLKINIDDYPAVKNWLANGNWTLEKTKGNIPTPIGTGKLRLEQTGATHTVGGITFKSRKQTNNKWFETQDSIGYWNDFSKHKICYSETNDANATKIAFDTDGYFTDKTCFIMLGRTDEETKQLYEILSSEVFSWYMKFLAPLLGTTGISLTKDCVELFPAYKDPNKGYDLSEEEKSWISSSLKRA